MLRPAWHGEPGLAGAACRSTTSTRSARSRPTGCRRTIVDELAGRGPDARSSRSATRASSTTPTRARGGPARLRGPARSAGRAHPRMGRRRRRRGRPGRTRPSVTRSTRPSAVEPRRTNVGHDPVAHPQGDRPRRSSRSCSSVGVVGFLWYAQPQPLLPEATAALASTEPWRRSCDGSTADLTFTPVGATPTTGLILYPGGKVPSAAYAPQARAIAERGYLVVDRVRSRSTSPSSASMPPDAVIADHPEIEHWAVGGHSLGGVDGGAVHRRASGSRSTGSCLWASYSAADLSSDGPGRRCPSTARSTPVSRRSRARRTSPSSAPNLTFDRHRRRQPRADGLVHGPAERPAGDDRRERPAGRRSSQATVAPARPLAATPVRLGAAAARPAGDADPHVADAGDGTGRDRDPADDEGDADELAGRRRLAEQDDRQARPSSTGWASRMTEVSDGRQPRQRDRMSR